MSEKQVVLLKDKQDIFEYIMKQANLIEELREENERLKERLDFFKDLAQRTEHEKEDYADKYYNLLKKKFSDDEIRRLYSDLQRREYEKHCNGGTTFTAKLKQEVRY